MRKTIWTFLYFVPVVLFAQDTIFYKNYFNNAYGKQAVIYEVSKPKSGKAIRFWMETNKPALKGFYDLGSLEGSVELYYPSGELYQSVIYDSGSPADTIRRYYRNGKLMSESIPIETEYGSLTYYDSRERVISYFTESDEQKVTDGNGIYKIIYPNQPEEYEQGGVKRGLKNGTWEGQLSKQKFREEYREGQLINGSSWDDKGNKFSYSQLHESASYEDGFKGFHLFLAKNLRYPREAFKQKIEGRVFVLFVVEEDGSLSNFEVVKSIGGGCDEEALRILMKSDRWVPGKLRGQPFRQPLVQNILFKSR